MDTILLFLLLAGTLCHCSRDPLYFPEAPDGSATGSTETSTTSDGGDGGADPGTTSTSDGGDGGADPGTTSTSSDTGGDGGAGGATESGGGGLGGSGGQGGTTSTPGPIGALCAIPDDCESGNCAVLNPANNAQGATGFCTFHPCGQDVTCGPGGVCRPAPKVAWLNICMKGCATTADCPAPFVCLPDLGACGVTPQ